MEGQFVHVVSRHSSESWNPVKNEPPSAARYKTGFRVKPGMTGNAG